MGLHETRRRTQRKLLVWLAVIMLALVSGSAVVMAKVETVASIARNDRPMATYTATHAPLTPTPTLSVTATPSVEATPTQIFYDDFINNNKQWAITNVPDLLRYMNNDQLVLSVAGRRILTESVPSTTSFSDFTLVATYTLVAATKNDSVGLYVRGDSNLDHDYRIEIFGDNTVTINKEYLDDNSQPQSIELARRTKVSAIHALGQMNTLTVQLNGPTISVAINGTPVISSLYDVDYSHGQIAFFVTNSNSSSVSVTARFSSLAIDSIPDPLPMPTPTPSITPSPTLTPTSTPSLTQTNVGTGGR
jgi:hypothetical protein